MRVIIHYIYKDEHGDRYEEFNHVFNMEMHLDYKLGAGVVLAVEGKRNKKRIPLTKIKHISVLD